MRVVVPGRYLARTRVNLPTKLVALSLIVGALIVASVIGAVSAFSSRTTR